MRRPFCAASIARTRAAARSVGSPVAASNRAPTRCSSDVDVHRAGLVGVALGGDIEVDTIVAQGCRPIGQPMFITKCHDNVLWELDGVSAATVLQELYEQLDPADQELARHSLFLGIVMSEHQQEYRQGDFLIRNIVGMDATRGVLGVGAVLRENSVVQFHLRDAKTSAEDLEQLLARYEDGAPQPHGALLFSCLGRGVHLYGQPGPRHRRLPPPSRRRPARRLLLQRRDRPRARNDLPARLHELVRDFQTAQRLKPQRGAPRPASTMGRLAHCRGIQLADASVPAVCQFCDALSRATGILEELHEELHGVLEVLHRHALVGAVDAHQVAGFGDGRREAVDILRERLVAARIGPADGQVGSDERAGKHFTDGARQHDEARRVHR